MVRLAVFPLKLDLFQGVGWAAFCVVYSIDTLVFVLNVLIHNFDGYINNSIESRFNLQLHMGSYSVRSIRALTVTVSAEARQI